MRKLFIYTFFILLPVLVTLSCKKDGAKLLLNENTSFSGPLQASANTIALTPANDHDTVIMFNWPAVSYQAKVAVNYTLELDVPGDTAGTNGWARAQKFVAGSNVLSFGFAGKDLNNTIASMGQFSTSPIVFRVLSDVNQYNGSASPVPTIYSGAVSVTITPYLTNLWVPGAYQGWSPSTAPVLNFVPGYAGVYEGYVYMPGTGNQGFKYTNAPDWNHINYGDANGEVGGGTMTTDGLAGGLSVANGGYYELSANLNNLGWKATQTTWGIIGDATLGGWGSDTQMTYDATNQVWTVTCVMKQAGSYKFRANNAWSIDFGIDNAGKLQYADNPLFTYNPNLNNLSVPADGTYVITLDLHVSQKYTYTAVKQ
jgi:hypothetical protein